MPDAGREGFRARGDRAGCPIACGTGWSRRGPGDRRRRHPQRVLHGPAPRSLLGRTPGTSGRPRDLRDLERGEPALLARRQNGEDAPFPARCNHFGLRHRPEEWFPVDIDPVRPSGVSSTEEEHDRAIRKAGWWPDGSHTAGSRSLSGEIPGTVPPPLPDRSPE